MYGGIWSAGRIELTEEEERLLDALSDAAVDAPHEPIAKPIAQDAERADTPPAKRAPRTRSRPKKRPPPGV